MSNNNNKVLPYWRTKFESFFDVGQHTIKVDMSSLTGRESIFVDDKLVAKKYNFGSYSIHTFNIGQKQYKVTIDIHNSVTGPIDIKLTSLGKYIDSDHWVFPNTSKVMMYCVVGMVAGFAAGFSLMFFS